MTRRSFLPWLFRMACDIQYYFEPEEPEDGKPKSRKLSAGHGSEGDPGAELAGFPEKEGQASGEAVHDMAETRRGNPG